MRCFFILAFVLPCCCTWASDSLSVHIDSITIDGNRKTRTAYILRELDFKIGDNIPLSELSARLERNRLFILNTSLFTRAEIVIKLWTSPQSVILHIQVAENWYIYPAPVFSLADRNFNVWWNEFDRSLERVNYGMDWLHNNLTGRADVLRASANFGYSNKYSISYRRPAINRSQTLGIQAGVSYGRTREVAYMTQGNKQVFRVEPGSWQLERRSLDLGLTWRPKLFTNHFFGLEFRDNRIADTIVNELNPSFFLAGRREQRHLSVIYSMNHDRRDFKNYAMKGWYLGLDARLNGLLPGDNYRLLRLQAEYARYHSFNRRFSLEAIGKARITLPRNKPPYFNNQALGYGGNFVRGYEYYVIDGMDFGLLKTSFRIALFSRTFNAGRLIPVDAFKIIPVSVYLTLNNDLGYSNDPYYALGNPLANRVLYGYGLGLDFLFFYDKSARFEYSWNDLGEHGLFVTIKTGI